MEMSRMVFQLKIKKEHKVSSLENLVKKPKSVPENKLDHDFSFLKNGHTRLQCYVIPVWKMAKYFHAILFTFV